MFPLMNKGWREVLGMNARQLDYIQRVNTPEAIALANNKLATKRRLQRAGLSTPRLFGVIRSRSELRRFRWTKLPSTFVLKPNASYGGGGIVVIFGRNKKGNWVKADKTEIFIKELKNHTLDILDGNFSQGNIPDIAFFEQRVQVHGALKPYTVKGIPDIRILLYNQVPTMAMLRLATEESAGRANIHAGGIGVGIDIATGLTTHAVHHGHLIDTIPDGRLSLSGIQMPDWEETILLAVRAAGIVGLDYAGIDITLDREDGPMVLEVNARPGLEIQFANLAPLKSRLRRVEGLKMNSIAKKIRLAKSLFGSDLEQEVEGMSGRTMLGVEEEISLLDVDGNAHNVLAKIDTGAWRTAVDETLAHKLGIKAKIVNHKGVRGALGRQWRPIAPATLVMRKKKIKTEVFITDRSHMKYPIIIGRRDLHGFLVDPSKPNKKT